MIKIKLIILFIVILGLILGIFMVYQKNGDKNIMPKLTIHNSKDNYSAWVPGWEEGRALASLNETAGKKLGTILPTWYELDAEGAVEEVQSESKDLISETAKQMKINIVPTLANRSDVGFDPIRVSKLITGSTKTDAINFLTNTAKEKGFHGWDLDLEEIAKKDRANYTEFVRDLADTLHSSNLTLSVTVHAQEDALGEWEGTSGQDLEGIGKYADTVRIMIYDFHHADSRPGAITPIPDLEKSINFAKSKIAPEKIVVGLPTYGYDWVSGGKGTPYQYQEIQTLLDLKQVKSSRNIESQELHAVYPNHNVWYLDSFTLGKLVDITKAYGISQICFWHLGGEDVTLWEKL